MADFSQRIAQLQRSVIPAAELARPVLNIINPTIEAFSDAETVCHTAFTHQVSGDAVDGFQVALQRLIDLLDVPFSPGLSDEVALKWAVEANQHLMAIIDRSEDGFDIEVPPLLRNAEHRRVLAEEMLESQQKLASINRHEDRARKAADSAERAAGDAGTSTFLAGFRIQARRELVSANVFRWLAVVAIIIAVMTAWLGLQWYSTPEGRADTSWPSTTLRLAFVAGIGALAGYFGRQAGQHRRMYNWARSIDIQLAAIPALASRLPADEELAALGLLIRRTLSSPPAGGGPQDDVVGSDRLADVVATVVKRGS